MFTEEFRKYLLIGITVVIIAVIVICASMGKTSSNNSTFKVSIIVQESLDTVNDWAKRQFSFAGDIFRLKEKNEELEKQIKELKLENTLNKKYKKENDKLRNLLKLDKEDLYKGKVAAKVVGVDPNNTYKVYIINKGSQDGVVKDMIALTEEGIAGRIIEAGKNYSKIMAVTDDRTTIGITVERTGEKLVLNGNNIEKGNTCKIENIGLDVDILEGDEVVTSNVSILYPEGIKIGKIKKILTSRDELTKKAIVKTATNINSLDVVYVIKNKEMLEDGIEEEYNKLDYATPY